MKTGRARWAIACLVLAATLSQAACDDGTSPQLASSDPVFDAGQFRENIETTLQQNSIDDIGYAFAINHLGQIADSAQVGFARMPQDGGVAHDISKEMNIASVTKWLTAVGALRLLLFEGIPLDMPMAGWLPDSWSQGPGVDAITFRELLTHRTGLTTDSVRYATDYNSLKAAIDSGVVNAAKTYNYSNINFALFRILFPYLDDISTTTAEENDALNVQQDTAAFDQYLADRYVALMQEYVFTLSHVNRALMRPSGAPDPTLMYYRFNTSESGTATGDWTLIGGGGGYYLSPREVASVMAHVFHSEDILASQQVTEMEDDLLGFDGSPATERGPAYQKNGALFRDTNGSGSFDSGDHGLETLIMKFPGDVELVLFVNSLGNGWDNFVPQMVDAFQNAWIDP